MDDKAVVLRLPWPPSMNHYWRRVGNRTLISREGRRYREAVVMVCRMQRVERIEGRLAVQVVAYPPDRRRRDLDNLQKALLDALEHAGVYDDDSQIDRLLIERGEWMCEGGRVEVWVRKKV